MKRLLSSLLLICMLFTFAMAVTAEEIADYESTKTITSYIDQGNKMVSIQYVLPTDVPPETVAQESFEEGGLTYTLAGVVANDIVTSEDKEVTVDKSRSATSRFGVDAFAKTLDYDEEGYTGTLERDDETFSISGTEARTVSKTVTKTKTYTGLARNDMSQIDKTYQGLSLASADWRDQGSGQSVSGYTEGTPGPYSCVALYTGVQTSRIAGSFSGSITYKGIVSREIITGSDVMLTYIGSETVALDSNDTDGTENNDAENPSADATAESDTLMDMIKPIALVFGGVGLLWVIYALYKKKKGK